MFVTCDGPSLGTTGPRAVTTDKRHFDPLDRRGTSMGGHYYRFHDERPSASSRNIGSPVVPTPLMTPSSALESPPKLAQLPGAHRLYLRLEAFVRQELVLETESPGADASLSSRTGLQVPRRSCHTGADTWTNAQSNTVPPSFPGTHIPSPSLPLR